jgi:hypothetical protein
MDIIKVKPFRPLDKNYSIYDDVIKHCEKPEINSSRYTSVHESSHFISSALRKGRMGYNGFYILDGNAAIVKEPPTTIGEVADYIPPNLRGFRYKLYFVEQRRYWDEQPLYIAEEWNCYTLGGMCAVDDYNHKRRDLERTDAVAGMFEFMVYSTALAMCVEDKCPEFWKKNKQFREFLQYRMDISSMIFAIGREIPQFKSLSSDKLYQTWHNSEEGKEFQNFIDKHFTNAEPVRWTMSGVF